MKYLFTYNGFKFHESEEIPPLNELYRILKSQIENSKTFFNTVGVTSETLNEAKIKYYKQF